MSRFWHYNLLLSLGLFVERTGRFLSGYARARTPAVFLRPEALAFNEARLRHLASLQLPLERKSVLEIGAGIGLLTRFFEERECDILSIEARPENVAEIRRQYPHRKVKVLDIEKVEDLSFLGEFDIVFCYGVLYHLSDPDRALQKLSLVCKEILLLETCVTPGNHLSPHITRENRHAKDQSFTGWGCRPTRPWIMDRLRAYFGFAYVTRTQPKHPDFDLDWISPLDKPLHRAVFIGSKKPLNVPTLLSDLPDYQTYVTE